MLGTTTAHDATQAISLPALIVKFHKTPSATFSLAGGALQQRINSDEARKLDPKDDTFEAIYDARYEGN